MSHRGTTTHTSKRTITETRNGQTYTKTIVTETTTGPDGTTKKVTETTVGPRGETSTKTTVETEGGGAPALTSSKFDDDFEKKFSELSTGGGHCKKYNDDGFERRFKDMSSGGGHKESEPRQNMDEYISDVIKAHNAYRKKHGNVGDLKNNKDLNVLAQKWADHLASIGGLQHSGDKYKGDQLGENVAYRMSSSGADYTGQAVTDQWYSEIAKYNFKSSGSQSGTGHFTQVVWKGSHEIGVGKAYSRDGKQVFCVCNYFPAGNFIGRFPENVFPPS